MVNKPGWLADSIAHPDGYYTVDGEKLKGVMLAPQQIEEWNSDAPEMPPMPEAVAPAPMYTPEPMEAMSTEEAQDLGKDWKEEADMSYTPDDEVQMLNESPTSMPDLEEMSKRELENLGREHGVELDRREKKSSLVEKMKNIIS